MNPNLNNQNFDIFKKRFADSLVTNDFDMADILALVTPLAVEEICDEKVWSHIVDKVLSNDHKIPKDNYLQCVSTLVWAVNKVNYSGMLKHQFW